MLEETLEPQTGERPGDEGLGRRGRRRRLRRRPAGTHARRRRSLGAPDRHRRGRRRARSTAARATSRTSPPRRSAPLVRDGRIRATTDYDELRNADAILIALPTPLSKQREPDLSIVTGAAEQIAHRLRPGHLVVLESTTYPRTTREVIRPILERTRPARPGTRLPPRLLAGARRPRQRRPGRRRTSPRSSAASRRPAPIAPRSSTKAPSTRVHRVSTPEAAELTKLLENIFRAVNIALVNELAQLCERMEIDVWEVIEAAATKPFGFMSFQPGPGLGGHCIPIDPFYLTWKAREYDFYDRVHRARRQGQREHAVLLPLARLAGAEPWATAFAERLEGADRRRRVQERHRRHA